LARPGRGPGRLLRLGEIALGLVILEQGLRRFHGQRSTKVTALGPSTPRLAGLGLSIPQIAALGPSSPPIATPGLAPRGLSFRRISSVKAPRVRPEGDDRERQRLARIIVSSPSSAPASSCPSPSFHPPGFP